jgi:hypothetical protein
MSYRIASNPRILAQAGRVAPAKSLVRRTRDVARPRDRLPAKPLGSHPEPPPAHGETRG